MSLALAESEFVMTVLLMSALQDMWQSMQPGRVHCILMALLC